MRTQVRIEENKNLIPNTHHESQMFDGSIINYGNTQKYFPNFLTGIRTTFRTHLDNTMEISDNFCIRFRHTSGECYTRNAYTLGKIKDRVEHFDVCLYIKMSDGSWDPLMHFHTDTFLQTQEHFMENVRGGGWASQLVEKYKDIDTFQKLYETLYSCLLKFGREYPKPTDNVFCWLKDSKFIGEFMTYLMSREDKRNFSDII